MLFATTWMDLEIIILSEVSQRKKNTTLYRLYVESKKKNHMNSYKREIDPQTQKTNLWLSKQKGSRDKLAVFDCHTHITI